MLILDFFKLDLVTYSIYTITYTHYIQCHVYIKKFKLKNENEIELHNICHETTPHFYLRNVNVSHCQSAELQITSLNVEMYHKKSRLNYNK